MRDVAAVIGRDGYPSERLVLLGHNGKRRQQGTLHPSKLSEEGYPSLPTPYATCARSSSMSRIWSSTQSPGFRA
jgi:hypothetical protein